MAALAISAASTELHGLSGPAELSEALRLSDTYTSLSVTATHRAIAALHKAGLVHYVITQNCDSLHRRSGVPSDALCTLHGDVFVEYCEKCLKEYMRPYSVDLYSTDCKKEKWYVECATCGWNHYTGRKCEVTGCGGKLRDTIVNFGDDLHAKVLGGLPRAKEECSKADLVICLGSSLTVTPACDLPRLTRKTKGKAYSGRIAIVNLQATELDDNAAVVPCTTASTSAASSSTSSSSSAPAAAVGSDSVSLRSFFSCDEFFALLMAELGIEH